MDKVTIKDLYKLRSTLKSRMIILNKMKKNGHYKNDVHSRGVENFIKEFLDSFCTLRGTNTRWNYKTSNYGSEEGNNHIQWGVKGQMKKLVVELRILLKNEGNNKSLNYDILCDLVKEYYPDFEKSQGVKRERGNNKPHDNTRRLYPGHAKLKRLLDIEETQGFSGYVDKYYAPYGTLPKIKINLP